MVALILFIALGLLILLLFELRERRRKKAAADTADAVVADEDKRTNVSSTQAKSATSAADESESGECCGQHLVCEKETLLSTSPEIVYYDDEELDVLSGIAPSNYSDEQMQMLQDVFYTLKENDVAGWVRSLQLRNIQLPTELRDEALLILREKRRK